MREAVTAPRLRVFMRALAAEAREPGRIYLTGGASAVLQGWRDGTSPADFVPALRGWEERSPFIAQEGSLAFPHFDFYTQALAKLERGHRKDLADVESMLRDRLVDPKRLRELDT